MTGCALSDAAWPTLRLSHPPLLAVDPYKMCSQGNIVLVDYEHKILSLLRAHKHDSTASASMVVGQPYPFEQFSDVKPLDVDELIANLEKGAAAGDPALKQHLSMTTGASPSLHVQVPSGRLSIDGLKTLSCNLQIWGLRLWSTASSKPGFLARRGAPRRYPNEAIP